MKPFARRGQQRPAEFQALSSREVDALADALKANDIRIELHVGPTTNVGVEARSGSMLSTLREELRRPVDSAAFPARLEEMPSQSRRQPSARIVSTGPPRRCRHRRATHSEQTCGGLNRSRTSTGSPRASRRRSRRLSHQATGALRSWTTGKPIDRIASMASSDSLVQVRPSVVERWGDSLTSSLLRSSDMRRPLLASTNCPRALWMCSTPPIFFN